MKILALMGKYMYALGLILAGWAHFEFPSYMMKFLAYPSPSVFISIVGVLYFLIAISIIIGKYDKLAFLILGIIFVIIGLSCHMLNIFTAGNDHVYMLRLLDLFKIIILSGSAFAMMNTAKDNRIVG